MSSSDLVLQLISIFDALQIEYMLVGSYSSNLYGRPRATKDADFVVIINPAQLHQLQSRLPTGFKLDPQMSFETITMTTRYIVNHPETAFKMELFVLSADIHDQMRFRRKQLIDFEGHLTWLPTPEDVVVTKLRWSKGGNRSKDVTDAKEVLKVLHASLDLPYIRHWCDLHNTRDLFERLLLESQKFEQEHP